MNVRERLDEVLQTHGEDLVDDYLQTVQDHLARLFRLEGHSFKGATKTIHTLVGTSAVLGFVEVAQLLKGIEQSVHQGNSTPLRLLLQPVHELIQELQLQRSKRITPLPSL